MKVIAFLLLAVLSATQGWAQDSQALYTKKFSYDLKQDKESVDFDGRTFWLRISNLKQKTLTLTYFLKGETPTTASETLTLILADPKETVESYTKNLLEQTKALRQTTPEIIQFDEFQGGSQQIVTFLIQDKSNNLVQDSVIRLTKWKDQNLTLAIHSVRLKLTEVTANPALAQKKIGDRRQVRLQAITYLNLPF